jgi:hypothetical protein
LLVEIPSFTCEMLPRENASASEMCKARNCLAFPGEEAKFVGSLLVLDVAHSKCEKIGCPTHPLASPDLSNKNE